MSVKPPKQMLVLVSIPAAGKSTYAMNLIKTEPKWVRVNRDDIRINNFGTELNHSIENQVTKFEHFMIKSALEGGYNVVIDNTNLKLSYRNEFRDIAKAVGNVQYSEKFFPTPLEQCLEWNKARSRQVPPDVMLRFYKQARGFYGGYEKEHSEYYPIIDGKGCPYIKQDETLPKAIIVDNDGTLSFLNGRNPYDATTCDQDLPNLYLINILHDLYYLTGKYKIVFMSGREDKYREPTINFYKKHLPWLSDYDLYMRKTGDMRRDCIIKQEMYEEFIKGKYHVSMWADDRLQVSRMIHELGLPLFRIGDPEANF
jgi:predicted kinase